MHYSIWYPPESVPPAFTGELSWAARGRQGLLFVK